MLSITRTTEEVGRNVVVVSEMHYHQHRHHRNYMYVSRNNNNMIIINIYLKSYFKLLNWLNFIEKVVHPISKGYFFTKQEQSTLQLIFCSPTNAWTRKGPWFSSHQEKDLLEVISLLSIFLICWLRTTWLVH